MSAKESRPGISARTAPTAPPLESAHILSRVHALADDLPSGVDLAIRRHIDAIGDLLRPRCSKCSHPLTAPKSIRRGTGPVCDKAAR